MMGCAGWALHKSLWMRGQAGTETGCPPPARPSTLAQQGNYPKKVAFSKWHKGPVEDHLASCDVWYAKLRHSHALLSSAGIFMVNGH